MKKYYHDIELLEQYNEGRLSQEEEHDVKSRLVNDEEFRALYDDMELMIEGILVSGRDSSIETKIANIGGSPEITVQVPEQEIESSTVVIPLSWYQRPVYATLAAALLLLAVVTVIINPFGSMSNDQLFDAHFAMAQNTSNAIRGGESLKLRAYAAYEEGRYQESVGLFQEYIESTDDDIHERYLQANAYMALGDYDRAIEILITVEEDGDGLKVPAKWYLGLCYLKTGEDEKAKEMMQAISESVDDKAEVAQEILRKME